MFLNVRGPGAGFSARRSMGSVNQINCKKKKKKKKSIACLLLPLLYEKHAEHRLLCQVVLLSCEITGLSCFSSPPPPFTLNM